MIDGGREIFFFQTVGELSGIWRLNFADTTSEDMCFSFVKVCVLYLGKWNLSEYLISK